MYPCTHGGFDGCAAVAAWGGNDVREFFAYYICAHARLITSRHATATVSEFVLV